MVVWINQETVAGVTNIIHISKKQVGIKLLRGSLKV